MNLIELFERIKHKKCWKSDTGTADIIFEIYESSARDESGRIPIIIKPDPPDKKEKKSLN